MEEHATITIQTTGNTSAKSEAIRVQTALEGLHNCLDAGVYAELYENEDRELSLRLRQLGVCVAAALFRQYPDEDQQGRQFVRNFLSMAKIDPAQCRQILMTEWDAKEI